MSVDTLQKQRFEMKYIISEHKAQMICFYAQNYLDLDSYGATQPHNSYPVHSLYLDSRQLRTYHDTINGNRNRFKLRIRYYESGDAAPVFFEIKRRYDKVIEKERAKVYRHAAPHLIAGHLPSRDQLVEPGIKNFESLEHFCRLVNELNAQPAVHVSYIREAYERKDSNAARLTMDRDVTTEYENQIRFISKQSSPVSVFGKKVVLELKFTDRFPDWMQEMVERFNLIACSAAKYVDGIDEMDRIKMLV